MRLSRRTMLASSAAFALAPAAHAAHAAGQNFTVLLDWFVNPDHAPLFAAKYTGAYEKAGLNVKLIAPTDPDIPPRLVAARQADIALSYQTQLYLLCCNGLPVRRTGTLINHTLNTVMALKTSGISKIADLKGRKIGYSVAGVEDVLIGTMLGTAGLKLTDVTLINVNFNLITALVSKEVDAVIGGYRNVEAIELRQQGYDPVIFKPEDYGVPPSDELIMLSNAEMLKDPRLPKFLNAVKQGAAYVQAHKEAMWQAFIKDQPSLDNAISKASYDATVGVSGGGYFADDPFYLAVKRYTNYRDFMFTKGLIKTKAELSDYAVQIEA